VLIADDPEFPRRRRAPSGPRAAQPAAGQAAPPVLLVEDDRTLGTVLSEKLEAQGYRADRAESLAQPLTALDAQAPGVRLLAVYLPNGSGWDGLRAPRAASRRVPTVVLSEVQASRSRLAEFRPEAGLPEPFPLETLLATVGRLTRTPAVAGQGGG
jgi:DNA-binding response OmpR family regulator